MATAFKQVVHQNLQCLICLGFFKDPKILTCSHTFCRECLETLPESYLDEVKLPCPVCREETSIPGGDVSRLQVNTALRSLVADVETQAHVCANCDPKLAVVYCNKCCEYLCESCKDIHSKWDRYSGHSLVATCDVTSGKVTLRRRCKCQKHPTDDEECFCSDCGKYVCFKCGVLEHAQEGHKIMEAALHENEQQKVIEELIFKADAKINDLDKYVTFVEDQWERLQKIESQLTNEIDEAFEEIVKKLTERKVMLKREVGQQIKKLATVLVDMKEIGRKQIVQVNAVCGLVKNGLKVPLQKEALTAHNTLCQELEEHLGRVVLDEEQPRRTADEGDKLLFMRSQGSDGLELGQIRRGDSKWILDVENELPTPDSMNTMAISPNNTMAVGCNTGGIVTYSADGILQETVLKTIGVRGFQFTSDGSYVIRDHQNTISLYTPQCEKRDVMFETLSDEEGGYCDLTVDRDGHILSSYRETNVIQVFTPQGGKAVREIQCDGYEPMQIFSTISSKTVVVLSDDHEVRVIDEVSGATVHSITKDNEFAHPAVCKKDDSVIIAWVKHNQGLVSIDQYTRELKYIKNILTDFKITKPLKRNWYYLQQFKTGEIAFCTPDRLYIFRETWEE